MAFEQRLTDIARSDSDLQQLLMWLGMSPETAGKLLSYKINIKARQGRRKFSRRLRQSTQDSAASGSPRSRGALYVLVPSRGWTL